MKKIILILLGLVMAIALASCVGSDESSDSSERPEASEPADYGSATVYTKGDKVQLISPTEEGRAFVNLLGERLTPMLKDDGGNGGTVIGSIYNQKLPLEVIVGYVDEGRPVTVKACKALDRIERKSYFSMRYVVYASSGSIAIVYDENEYTNLTVIESITLKVMETLFSDKKYVALPEGVVISGTVDLIAAQEALDVEKMAEQWSGLEEVYGEEFADACKSLYSLYGDDLVEWVANLYDPGVGGFYASSGGRDGVEFGPDVQCTVQLLRFIVSTGMVDDIGTEWTEFIPKFMQQQMVYFAKSLQDSKSGFFYHPQWGKEATDQKISRRGRDLSWAVSLLDGFGYKPTYNTPDGVLGDGVTADEYWNALELAGEALSSRPHTYAESPVYNFGTGAAEAVRNVIGATLTASVDSNTYLSTHEGFINYLLVKLIPGIHSNPYQMGNEVGSASSEIQAVSERLGVYVYTAGDEANTDGATAEDYYQFDGKTLVEMLTETLIKHINPETGLWGDLTEKEPNGTEFRYTNGFMKTINSLTSNGVAYPVEYIPKAASALVDGILGDEPSTSNCCDIYNVWTCVGLLKSNMKLIDDAQLRAEVEATVDQILAEKAPAAILNTYDKIKGYKKYDGGFAHNYYTGTGMHQSLPVGVASLNQSDVDGTCISSTGLLRAMFEALKVPDKYIPNMYCESDWMRMLEIFLEQNEVVKYDYNGDAPENKTFDYEGALPPSTYLAVQNANDNNTFTVVDLGSRGGVGLFSKTEKDRQLYLDWKINYAEAGANATFFETDIMFTALTSAAAPVELRFYNGTDATTKVFTLYFHVSELEDGKTVYISDNVNGKNKVAVGKIGEFISVRLAYHQGVADDPTSPSVFAAYINGAEKPSLVCERGAADDYLPASSIGYARFIAMGAFLGSIYLDNTGFITESLEYASDSGTPSEPSIPSEPGEPSIPAPPVGDGEKGEGYFGYNDGIPKKDYLTVQKGNANNTFTAVNLDGKTAGLFSKTEADIQFYLDWKISKSLEGANATFFETDIMFTDLTSAAAPVELRFYDGTDASTKIFTLYFHVSELDDGGNVYISDNINGRNKVAVAKIGEWFTLRLVYFEGVADDESAPASFKVYINESESPTFVSETFQNGTAISASSVGYARFITMGAFLGKIYLDDTGFIRDNLTYSYDAPVH